MNKDDNKKTHIIVTGKGGGGSGTTDWNDITNKPDFATVATSGSYTDLNDKPTILTQWFGTQAEYDAIVEKDPNVIYNIEGSDNVQADWNQTDTTADDYIKNKPTIPAAQVNADWNSTSGVSEILNKPSLATVATTGNYSDLNGTPSLATVATSGDYDDLQNKPTIPAAPVQSDWNEADSSSLAYIANKPTIPAAQVNSDWNANSGVAQILNKPTIPVVPAMATETLTFTLQGGTTKTIEFYTVPNYFYVEDISGSDNTLSITKTDVSAPTIEVFKSTDRMNWTSMGSTSTTAITATIPANGKLYLKAITNAWGTSNNPHNIIIASKNYNVGGNIMSLLYGDDFNDKTTFQSVGVFKNLFANGTDNNTKLISAEKLILPATTLTDSCYYQMFYNCTALTKAPTLTTTILGTWCYGRMFYGCSSLNKVVTYANNISASQCLYNWLSGVAATGDFYNLGGATYTSGNSGIPSGWTEHTSL